MKQVLNTIAKPSTCAKPGDKRLGEDVDSLSKFAKESTEDSEFVPFTVPVMSFIGLGLEPIDGPFGVEVYRKLWGLYKQSSGEKMLNETLRGRLIDYLTCLSFKGNALFQVLNKEGRSSHVLARLIQLLASHFPRKRLALVVPTERYAMWTQLTLNGLNIQHKLGLPEAGVMTMMSCQLSSIMIIPYDIYMKAVCNNVFPRYLLSFRKHIECFFSSPSPVIFYRADHMDGIVYREAVKSLSFDRLVMGIVKRSEEGLGLVLPTLAPKVLDVGGLFMEGSKELSGPQLCDGTLLGDDTDKGISDECLDMLKSDTHNGLDAFIKEAFA